MYTHHVMKIPLYLDQISAGFPSPAEDFIEKRLSLDELLVFRPTATFFIRVKGDSMKNAGIHSDDILVVDRSLESRDGSIVVAILNGEFLVKRLKKNKMSLWLFPENPNFSPLPIKETDDFEVWGVVTSVIHRFVFSLHE